MAPKIVRYLALSSSRAPSGASAIAGVARVKPVVSPYQPDRLKYLFIDGGLLIEATKSRLIDRPTA